jgi:aerobic-type carbon monoxide dehydrogenase small subunit (CoxS/CutS family)
MMPDINFTLNGKAATVNTDPDRPLLWVLRTDLGLTGTKCGCAMGQCGACTVLLDGRPVRSCLVTMRGVDGRKVTTIEGLAQDGKLHPVQQAFVEFEALQCGFCTPGMIMSAVGLLNRTPKPTEAEIRAALQGNLCRCGTHQRVIQAVQSAAQHMGGS